MAASEHSNAEATLPSARAADVEAAASVASTSASADSVVTQGKSSSLYSTLFESNPYFNAGFGLMLFGAVLALSRRGMNTAASQVQRRLLVTLEIPSKDRAHPWFLQWMGAQAKAQAMREAGLLPGRRESLAEFIGIRSRAEDKSGNTKQADDPLRAGNQRASPIRIFSHELSLETIQADLKKPGVSGAQALGLAGAGQAAGSSSGSTSRDARFAFVPGPGTHWFRYRGCWMRLTRERNGRLVDLTTGAPWETISLTTLRSHQYLFNELLAEARQLALTSTEGKTTIYTAWGTEWRPFGQPRRARDLHSVVLDDGKSKRLESDVRRFMQRGWWYAERGIPYRRGYLLHGSPGSGKTSFIYALAGSLDMSICLLNLAERGLTDDKLNYLLSNAPERSIILLEDVDSAFLGRQRAPEADGYQANVTFSGLLNSLDGVASSESRIIFMTTNHVEKLDPALIRPGRVDYIEEVGDATYEQTVEIYKRFYGLRRTRLDTAAMDAEIVESSIAIPTQLQGDAERLAHLVLLETKRRRKAAGLSEDGRLPAKAMNGQSDNTIKMNTIEAAATGGVSMAELQGLFIQHPDDGRAAITTFCKVTGLQED
jgi:chaperone BCS1